MSVKRLLKYLRPYKLQCVAGPVFKLIEAVLELFLPLLMAGAIDRGAQTGDTGYIIRMGGIMLAVVTVGFGCALVCQYMASVTSQGFGTGLRSAVFRKITGLSFSQSDRFGPSSLTNRVTNDINQLQFAVAMLIRLVIRAPFLCIGGVIMAVSIDLRLSLIIIFALPLFILLIYFIMRATVRLHRIVQAKLDALSLILRENLSGIRVVRAFARDRQEQTRFSEAVGGHTDMAIRVGRLSSLLNPATQLIMNIAILAIVWLGGFRVQSGQMTTGEVIAFISYVNQILLSLIVVANLVITFTRAYASAGRVSEILDAEPLIQDGDTVRGQESEYAVEFENVFFSYDEGEDELEDISFKIRRGETFGIIGGTGSGKTTLLNLIPRFYDVRRGRVTVNGLDVRAYRLSELRKKIGAVSQKTELFSGTVADNLRLGADGASDGALRLAADTAQASAFIDAKPEGFLAALSRGGSNLSGGQRQRLSIARAIVRKPEILLLDDASSALDYATDAAFRKALHEETKKRGMTVIIVSQRVESLKQCDRILVLDDGRIAGLGAHPSLLSECETYREIYAAQRTNGNSAEGGKFRG